MIRSVVTKEYRIESFDDARLRVLPVAAILIVALTLVALHMNAQLRTQLPIIPAPVNEIVKKGKFVITPSTTIVLASTNIENSAAFLNNYLKRLYGFELKIANRKTEGNNAVIIDGGLPNSRLSGSYEMTVDKMRFSFMAAMNKVFFMVCKSCCNYCQQRSRRNLIFRDVAYMTRHGSPTAACISM